MSKKKVMDNILDFLQKNGKAQKKLGTFPDEELEPMGKQAVPQTCLEKLETNELQPLPSQSKPQEWLDTVLDDVLEPMGKYAEPQGVLDNPENDDTLPLQSLGMSNRDTTEDTLTRTEGSQVSFPMQSPKGPSETNCRGTTIRALDESHLKHLSYGHL